MNEIFRTKDLPLATYLKCKGIDLIEIYNHNTKEWLFDNPEECKKYSLQLSNGSAIVDVLEYEKHRKNLLGMTHYVKK